MTRTEERLIAALESAAAAVPVEAARPLAAPERSRSLMAWLRWRGLSRYAHGRRAWLAAALAAAASIAAFTALVAVNGQRLSPGPVLTSAYIGGSEPRVPAFFVDAGSTGLYDQRLRVVSLATGAVTAIEHAPAGTEDITFLAEQAQTGNYIAAFINNRASGLAIYRFRITGTGKITALTRIRQILLNQQAGTLTALALSPDGSRLALSLTANNVPARRGTVDAKIILLNLSSGARQVWNDNLAGSGYLPQITSAVWTKGGQALVFASHVCRPYPQQGACSWEIRTLVRTGRGLRAGAVLLRQKGTASEIPPMAITPDSASVVEVRSSTTPGNDASLVRISLATGSQTVLHRWRTPGPFQVGANEGNFLLVGQQLHRGNDWQIIGWVNDAGFHSLQYPPRS